MAGRVHVLMDRAEKERFRRLAAREGKSLSEWLREAAAEKAAAAPGAGPLESADALEAFFAGCDERETGTEPDWEAHRKVIERSQTSGAADS